MSHENDQHAATDLELYLLNDGQIHIMHDAVRVNMLRKLKRLKYDSELAVKAFLHVADAAAQRYTKELRTPQTHGSYGLFSPQVRRYVARELRDRFEAAGKAGELSHLQRLV